MSDLLSHINSGKFLELYSEYEKSHVLSFSYNLISWMERDGADRLERKPTEFIWSNGQDIVGTFPITVPEPKPSFIETLLCVFERDKVVREHLAPTYDGAGVFRFNRK
jgi:hypothetical protein